MDDRRLGKQRVEVLQILRTLLDNSGYRNQIPDYLRYYFGIEAYARDLRLGGDACEDGGYYF